jgi:hypothetical protein
MKAAILILLPIGLVFISYFILIKEMNKPIEPYVVPEWVPDKYGRYYPSFNYNPPTTKS